MKKGILICVLIAGVLVSTGCSGSRVKAPERVFEPEEAFFEIPHSSFEAEWLEGGMKDEDGHVYEEVYDFVLAMDRAVIPYTVSGKLIQTCEYNPSEGRLECGAPHRGRNPGNGSHQVPLEAGK